MCTVPPSTGMPDLSMPFALQPSMYSILILRLAAQSQTMILAAPVRESDVFKSSQPSILTHAIGPVSCGFFLPLPSTHLTTGLGLRGGCKLHPQGECSQAQDTYV